MDFGRVEHVEDDELGAYRRKVRAALLSRYTQMQNRSVPHETAFNTAVAQARQEFPFLSVRLLRNHLTRAIQDTSGATPFAALLLS